jgi:hypothetical protein
MHRRSLISAIFATASVLTSQSFEAHASCNDIGICGKTIEYSGRLNIRAGSPLSYNVRHWVYFSPNGMVFYTSLVDGKNVGSVCSEAGQSTNNICPGSSCDMEKKSIRQWVAQGQSYSGSSEIYCKFNTSNNQINIQEKSSRIQKIGNNPDIKHLISSVTVIDMQSNRCSVSSNATQTSYHSNLGPFYGTQDLSSNNCKIKNGNTIPR